MYQHHNPAAGGTNGFDLDTKTIDPSCPDECLAGVTDYFQPYARAITRLTVLSHLILLQAVSLGYWLADWLLVSLAAQ